MTSATLPGWKPLTGLSDPRLHNGRLRGALLTTFDPPDPGLLIEEYLPVWLGLENSYANEGNDRLRYFAELEDALKRLRGQIAIVSSAGELATSTEAWIWNYIRRFEVGAEGSAVQHAKLWMFHRDPPTKGKPETLELIISSANLTRDGLRGQIQAGWRCVLPLRDQGSKERLKAWGVLPGFLFELGKASGNGGSKMIERWHDLLRRCDCPKDAEFVASIPGIHSANALAQRHSTWGAAGLRASWSGRAIRKMVAMAPTIGRWTSESISDWAELIGVEPSHISVAWLRDSHPWAGNWQLDPPTEAALSKSGIQWLEVPVPEQNEWKSPLCNEHEKNDLRWSHAKLYELREGRRRRMLITSANLSRAAWGDPQRDGKLKIENFELGVLLRVQDGFGDRLCTGSFKRATRKMDYQKLQPPPIAWLAAEWNGKELAIECRTSGASVLESFISVTAARTTSIVKCSLSWKGRPLNRARMPWPQAERGGVPFLVAVQTMEGDTRQVAVHDVRPIGEDGILCGEFDEPLLREALDRLLEERYGYAPDTGFDGSAGNGGNGTTAATGYGDYSVLAYVDARRRFKLIDNLWTELQQADDCSRSSIAKDGKRIVERWLEVSKSSTDRNTRLAAKIAADELARRIRGVV